MSAPATRADPAPVESASPALVVGLSIHGLAVARALARQGVIVHCLADVEVPPQPTVYTRYAKVHFSRGLNSAPLDDVLLKLADRIGSARKIVLFPTSDRIAKAIAVAWPALEARCLLSWSGCRELVLELQRKDSLPRYFEAAGVLYPKSRVMQSASDLGGVTAALRFPLAVKPAQPLSSFKALRVETPAALGQCIAQYAADLPFVVQEWIDGPEPSLYACTTYLDHGRALFAFTSRKIAASPPGTGQGTVFETADCPDAREAALRFVATLDLSGPVALEFKRDADGRFWLIEPNVGRTEYCVDLAVQSGFNQPYIEYLHATGQPLPQMLGVRAAPRAWFDTDKDPFCFLRNLGTLRDEHGVRRAPVFPFLGHDDRRPLLEALRQRLWAWARAPFTRIARRFQPAAS